MNHVNINMSVFDKQTQIGEVESLLVQEDYDGFIISLKGDWRKKEHLTDSLEDDDDDTGHELLFLSPYLGFLIYLLVNKCRCRHQTQEAIDRESAKESQ
jgi:hypothetical protein